MSFQINNAGRALRSHFMFCFFYFYKQVSSFFSCFRERCNSVLLSIGVNNWILIFWVNCSFNQWALEVLVGTFWTEAGYLFPVLVIWARKREKPSQAPVAMLQSDKPCLWVWEATWRRAAWLINTCTFNNTHTLTHSVVCGEALQLSNGDWKRTEEVICGCWPRRLPFPLCHWSTSSLQLGIRHTFYVL